MNENQTQQAAAEQLCKMLDAQLAVARSRRDSHNASRGAIRIAGVLLLVLGTAFAVWLLMMMLDDVGPSLRAKPAPEVAP